MLTTGPSRRALTSTWFSTTTGPEATKTLSFWTLTGWSTGCAGAAAATTSFEPLHPLKASPSSIVSPITMYRFITSPRFSPTEPRPDLRPHPHAQPPEKDLSGRSPRGEYLAAALHSRADQAFVIGDADPRKKDAVVAQRLAPGTYHRQLATECVRRKSIKFDGSLLAGPEKRDIMLIDGNVHACPRRIDDFRKGISWFQILSDQVLDMSRSHHTVDRRTQQRLLQPFTGAGNFTRPVVRLHPFDSRLGAVVG